MVDEFDVAAFNKRAAAWWLRQRHALGAAEHASAEELVGEHRAHLHPLERIVAALERHFDVGTLHYGPYLYRWDLDESLRHPEEDAIARAESPQSATTARAATRVTEQLALLHSPARQRQRLSGLTTPLRRVFRSSLHRVGARCEIEAARRRLPDRSFETPTSTRCSRVSAFSVALIQRTHSQRAIV